MTLAVGARAAFDEVAATYDHDFTDTRLGRLLRERVWAGLESVFVRGSRVLELGCGTGEDALWLARRGISVVATDASAGMLHVAAAKLRRAGLADHVTFAQLDARQPHAAAARFVMPGAAAASVRTSEPKFDGVLANFGVLNCVPNRRVLADWLGNHVLGPGGALVAVVMGPFCAWEAAWYLAKRDLVRARRRSVSGGVAQVGQARLPVWYPSPRRLAADFSPWFAVRQPATGIGSLLPPSHLRRLVDRWPGLFTTLGRAEAYVPLSAHWADHYLIVFERRC